MMVDFFPLKLLFPDGCPHCLLVPWVFWAVVFCAAEASSGLHFTSSPWPLMIGDTMCLPHVSGKMLQIKLFYIYYI